MAFIFGGGAASHMTTRDRAMQRSRDAEANAAVLNKYVSANAAYSAANKFDDTLDIRRKQLEVDALAREAAMESMTRTVRRRRGRRVPLAYLNDGE
jgi:hypothetical protein